MLAAPGTVPIGRNATYSCTTVEDFEVKWSVETPDGDSYNEVSLDVSLQYFGVSS